MNLTERYFRALGWEFGSFTIHPRNSSIGFRYSIKSPDGEGHNSLPNITEHFPSFKKWVLEEMERRGFKSFLQNNVFSWVPIIVNQSAYIEEIIDGEWLSAAIEAACEYLEGEKG